MINETHHTSVVSDVLSFRKPPTIFPLTMLSQRYPLTFLFPALLLSSHVLVTRGNSRVQFASDYSVHERPPTEEGEPVMIEASINVRNILEVAEKEQIISLETTLRLYWKVV